jgi:hypothetical protein
VSVLRLLGNEDEARAAEKRFNLKP